MDLFQDEASGVSEPALKKQAVKSRTEEKEAMRLKTLLVMVAKLALVTALTARILKSVLIDCWKLPV